MAPLPPSGAVMTPAELLVRLAAETNTLDALARALPPPGRVADETHLADAQKQDLLEQTLAELSAFLRAAAPAFEGLPARDLGPALAAIRLSDLEDRLAGNAARTAPPAGDVDFF